MRKGILFVLVIGILATGFLAFIKIGLPRLPGYLSESHKTDANVLIIESWLSEASIDIVKPEIHKADYDLIVATGIPTSDLDFCMVAMNGYLIFYPEFPGNGREDSVSHTIGVNARSKMGGIYRSHFNFFINDSLLGDFNADEKPATFCVKWNRPLKDIDSLMIQFTNDTVGKNGDRNLYIREIVADNSIIVPYQYNSIIDFGALGGGNRISNDFESHSQKLRNKLISDGIDPAKIIAVTGKKAFINRTLKSAFAVKKVLRDYNQNIRGINIMSMGIHSRRTWLTYKRILDKSIEVGIIALPETGKPDSGNLRALKTLGETLDLIYYWIILFPYSLT